MNKWPIVKLGNILRRIERDEKVDAEKSYNLLGIRLEGRGPFLRESVMGTQTSATKLFRVEKDDFIYSRLFACRGAFGTVSQELSGCYVSNEFPTFTPVPDKLDVEFLKYWFMQSSILKIVDADCTGSTPLTRNRYKERFFLALEVPLPPLDEQRRIVARIEELTAQINEAKELRRRATEDRTMIANRFFEQQLARAPIQRTRLHDLLSEPLMNGLSVPASSLGTGICFAKVGIVNSGVFNPDEVKFVNIELTPNSPYWLQKSDLLVSRGNCPDFVGRAAIYEGTPKACAIPDLLIRARIDEKKADVRFISKFFHTSEARDYILSQVSGTSSTMPKISQAKLNRLPIPIPPLSEQHRIVAELNALQSEIDTMRNLQTETSAELNALLPVVLDRAFIGEL